MTPQEETIQTYQNNFDLYKEKTASEVSGEFVDWMDEFMKLLPPGGNIFELGSAHGRDARYLRERGFHVFCTDIIPQAIDDLKSDGFDATVCDYRNEPNEEWLGAFDGIIAKAVYLHGTQEEFEKSLSRMGAILKPNGIFCLSFKIGAGEEIETGKLAGTRYFKFYTIEELKEIIGRHPQFELVKTSETSDKKWVQLLLRLQD